MKPLALNLSQMKKVASDGKSSTFQHPKGHQIVVAHNGISAIQREQIKKMPMHKFAGGGSAKTDEFDDMTQSLNPFLKSDQTAQGYQDAHDRAMASLPTSPDSGSVNSDSDSTPQDAQASQPDEPQSPPLAQASQSQTTPPAAPAPGIPNFQDSYNQGQNAITEQQNIDTQKAKDLAPIAQNEVEQRQKLQGKIDDAHNIFQTAQEKTIQDIKDGYINPNHYVENMSTPSKVATGIGLLLGGFSTPFTHQGNPAMDMLNKQIDRDIASQEANQSSRKTLLGANQEMFKDKILSDNQTRINMNDIYDHRIQLEALKLGTPQAKANADAAHAKFAMENQGLLQQNAVRLGVMNHLKEGGGGLSALDLAQAGMIPQADALKEQASIDSQKKAMASVNDVFNAYEREQTAGNLVNPQSYRRVDELNAQNTNAVMESDASHRLTPESAKLEVKPFWVNTTDTPETRRDKHIGVNNLIRQHAAPTPYMSRYSPQSLPQYGTASLPAAQTSGLTEGRTGTRPNGQRVVVQGGKIVPINGGR